MNLRFASGALSSIASSAFAEGYNHSGLNTNLIIMEFKAEKNPYNCIIYRDF